MDTIARLAAEVKNSYAHNSRLYERLADEATLDEVTAFLQWDAVQPAFNVYLRHWLAKAPTQVRPALIEHIALEESEQHARLFKDMLTKLESKSKARARPDTAALAKLNYTFSEECANEREFAFFVGGFYATEIMAAKRCAQLHRGLIRLGFGSDELTYLKIHLDNDDTHAREIEERFIAPLLGQGASASSGIEAGLVDRLNRSSEYLRWYESKFLR